MVIQATPFTVDLHVLPIACANVVLGVQWMKSLSLVLTDYNTLCMKFFHEGSFVEHKGDTESTWNSLSSSKFHHLCRKHPNSLYLHVIVLYEASFTKASSSSDTSPLVQALLDKFQSLFQPPHALPPPRDTDHRIHLLPQATSVNVHPYRYPHYQKQEIENQVESMLQKGLIRPNTSPFFVSGITCQETGWIVAVLYGLSSLECTYHQGPISHTHRR